MLVEMGELHRQEVVAFCFDKESRNTRGFLFLCFTFVFFIFVFYFWFLHFFMDDHPSTHTPTPAGELTERDVLPCAKFPGSALTEQRIERRTEGGKKKGGKNERGKNRERREKEGGKKRGKKEWEKKRGKKEGGKKREEKKRRENTQTRTHKANKGGGGGSQNTYT